MTHTETSGAASDPIELHRRHGGKIQISSRVGKLTAESLAQYYTPGVAAVSRRLAKHPEQARDLTAARRSVAIVSDGSAVLGLGNVGPEAALPVMEGKALLFRALAEVDAWPIVLATQDPDEIVAAISAIAPGFGGINLEDIAAPQCFEIERRLQAKLAIPVVHDDQHATAIVVLAGLINALKVVGKDLSQARVVVNGAGAAGSAIVQLCVVAGLGRVTAVDSQGIIHTGRTGLTVEKRILADVTQSSMGGDLLSAVSEADALIGVSVGGAFTAEHIQAMASDPIIFSLANPDPEILPEDALAAGARVVATGRSDFPNQINNVLVFPGLFKGLMAAQKLKLTDDDKIRVAQTLAGLVSQPTAQEIIPSVFDERVVSAVVAALTI